jgi:diguanylate cyclase (GGDEF)-like protein
LGHPAGDRALERLAALLDADTRQGDIACRYGGDEFVLVLPDTALAAALEKSERLRVACKRMGTPGVPDLTISVGVACAPDHGGEGEQLLLAADQALYRAKEDGRDRVCAAEQ